MSQHTVTDSEFLVDVARPARLSLAELRADLPPALRLAVVVLLAGVPLGVLWSLLVPRVGTVVLAGGVSGTLPGATDHVFDQVAVFVLLTVGFGVVAGAVAWRRRAVRGPVVLVAVVVANLVGAWLAGRIGVWLADGLLLPGPVPVLVDRAAISAGSAQSGSAPPLPASFTTAPPSPGPWWIVVAAGLAAALTYVLAAIADGHEDPRRT